MKPKESQFNYVTLVLATLSKGQRPYVPVFQFLLRFSCTHLPCSPAHSASSRDASANLPLDAHGALLASRRQAVPLATSDPMTASYWIDCCLPLCVTDSCFLSDLCAGSVDLLGAKSSDGEGDDDK